VTITTPEMTRFLLSLDKAVDTVFAALAGAKCGETYIPRVPSARVVDIASALIGNRPVETVVTGIRPGEKIDEILVSDEERFRTVARGEYYAILPLLPELRDPSETVVPLAKEYSSSDNVMDLAGVEALLHDHGLMIDDAPDTVDGELLR